MPARSRAIDWPSVFSRASMSINRGRHGPRITRARASCPRSNRSIRASQNATGILPWLMSYLRYVPPMGIYETLYAFLGAFGRPMGDAGTHPWSQGFPRTDQLPGGPPMPVSVPVVAGDLKYPKAWGLPALREAIADYYRTQYGTRLTADNVMVFAGGRPALIAILFFLERDIAVRIAETEYTPYFDMLERLGRTWSMVPSGESNGFSPTIADYLHRPAGARSIVLLSNPCNPTGVTR